MYIMMRGLVIDGHNSFSLTSLSLLYRFANVLHIWALFLLLNTFWDERWDIVTVCNELLYITRVGIYTVSKESFWYNETQSVFLTFFYIWTKFLLLSTFWIELPRYITLCNDLLFKVGFNLNNVYMTRFDVT
jgi:hypothetical protein